MKNVISKRLLYQFARADLYIINQYESGDVFRTEFGKPVLSAEQYEELLYFKNVATENDCVEEFENYIKEAPWLFPALRAAAIDKLLFEKVTIVIDLSVPEFDIVESDGKPAEYLSFDDILKEYDKPTDICSEFTSQNASDVLHILSLVHGVLDDRISERQDTYNNVIKKIERFFVENRMILPR